MKRSNQRGILLVEWAAYVGLGATLLSVGSGLIFSTLTTRNRLEPLLANNALTQAISEVVGDTLAGDITVGGGGNAITNDQALAGLLDHGFNPDNPFGFGDVPGTGTPPAPFDLASVGGLGTDLQAVPWGWNMLGQSGFVGPTGTGANDNGPVTFLLQNANQPLLFAKVIVDGVYPTADGENTSGVIAIQTNYSGMDVHGPLAGFATSGGSSFGKWVANEVYQTLIFVDYAHQYMAIGATQQFDPTATPGTDGIFATSAAQNAFGFQQP